MKVGQCKVIMRRLTAVAAVLAVSALFGVLCHAQFKTDVYSQEYKDSSKEKADTTDKLLDFREIAGGLAHKRTMRMGSMFGTSLVIPGAAQIYNQEYWKLPIFYTGIAGGLTAGTVCHFKYQQTGDPAFRTARLWSFVGAGVFYYASLFDGVASYKAPKKPYAPRATLYSVLLPGLGQAYNGEYWKIPIYVGGIGVATHFVVVNNTNYERFRNIYREAAAGQKTDLSADQAKYYRDEYRRLRDYSILAVAAVYLLQVIDANVFCYMYDFEVTDKVTAKLTPTVIMPEGREFAVRNYGTNPAFGASFALRF